MTIDNVLEILEKHKLHIPSNVFYELKADIVNFEEPTTKNDLGVENDSVSSIVEKISEKVTETREEFIFETIRPYCENVVQMKISKRDLEQALLKYYGKNDLGVDCISRISALDSINWAYNLSDAYQKINDLPSVTPQEPRKGHWITRPHIYGVAFCSECGFELKINNTNYCPNCGCRMVEPQESEG